jgi:hypothetical protein
MKRINLEKILENGLIGKEVDTYYYEIENNKVVGNIYRKSIIQDVFINRDNPEDIGLTITALLKNGKSILLEPVYNNTEGYREF